MKNGNDMKYICVAPEGAAVAWNPDMMPNYWKEVTEEDATE